MAKKKEEKKERFLVNMQEAADALMELHGKGSEYDDEETLTKDVVEAVRKATSLIKIALIDNTSAE